MLPQWLKDYLSFHHAERRAIIGLVIFIGGLIAFNLYQRFFWRGDWEEIQLKYGVLTTQFYEETNSISQVTETPEPWIPKTKELFKFDPNTLDSAGWVALGFSPKQSASIIEYRSAGAKFRKPEDIKKLFVVDDVRYEELQPFVDIKPIEETRYSEKGQTNKFESKPKWEKPEYVPKNIELNTADSAMLVELQGIGPFFARVIIEHRDKLGGYLAKEQVREVYGMDSVKFAKIESELWVDPTLIRKTNINQATIKELVGHPYINFNQAKAIVNYREQHGQYKQLKDLRKIHLIDEPSYTKIAPYLKL